MPDHTGTWQFISTARLLDPADTTHLPLDDMESVFWVFLYLALKYGNHELTGEAVGNFLMNTFDYMQSENGFYIGGRLGKGNVIKDTTLRLETEFRPKMLNTILQLMHGAFHLRYATPEWQSSDVFDEAEREDEEKEFRVKAKEHADKMKRLEDSTYLQKVIKHFTSDAYDWSNDGTAIRHEIPPPPDQASRLSTPKRRSYSHHAEQYKRAIRRRLIV